MAWRRAIIYRTRLRWKATDLKAVSRTSDVSQTVWCCRVISNYSHRGETVIGRTIPRYRIVDKLGQGGMSVVYKAGDESPGPFEADAGALLDSDALAGLAR